MREPTMTRLNLKFVENPHLYRYDKDNTIPLKSTH